MSQAPSFSEDNFQFFKAGPLADFDSISNRLNHENVYGRAPLLKCTVEGSEREMQAKACKMFTNQRDAGETECPPGRERLFGTVCIGSLSLPRKDTVWSHDFIHACQK